MSEGVRCRCGHDMVDHAPGINQIDLSYCTVVVDSRTLEEPPTYCQCGEYFPATDALVLGVAK